MYFHIHINLHERKKPPWTIKEERQEEASNPGPLPVLIGDSDDEDLCEASGPPIDMAADIADTNFNGADTDEEVIEAVEDEPIQRSAGLPQQQEKEHTEDQAATHIVFETSNITSGNKNWPTALAREAAVQFVQETCLTKEQMALRTKEAEEP